jgi:hypothetical protein
MAASCPSNKLAAVTIRIFCSDEFGIGSSL